MLQGGAETIAGTLAAGIGSLSLPEGQSIQDIAYNAILEAYSDPDEAWEKCLTEEKVPYIEAIYRECLVCPMISRSKTRISANSVSYRGFTLSRRSTTLTKQSETSNMKAL